MIVAGHEVPVSRDRSRLRFIATGLEAVVAAREPLNREQLAALIGLDAEGEVPLILARLTSFLPFRDRTYALFHRSLFEWLTEWDRQQDQPVAGPYHISLKKGQSRLADWRQIIVDDSEI